MPSPQGELRRLQPEDKAKKRWRETMVMDKPVVSVGELGVEGAVVGVGR